MGWSSGTDIAVAVAKALVRELPDPEARRRVYEPLVTALNEGDWDTQDEAMGIDPVLDKLLDIDPEEADDEDGEFDTDGRESGGFGDE